MDSNESQEDVNNTEWGKSENWSSLYFSKKDSRTFVPKKNPKHGWTINFGSESGSRWIYYLFGLFFLIGCFIGANITTLLMI